MDKAWIVHENNIKTIVRKHTNLPSYCKSILSHKKTALYS
jgi:hypothetical protein